MRSLEITTVQIDIHSVIIRHPQSNLAILFALTCLPSRGKSFIFQQGGITHVVTLTCANVVERFIRTMKKMMHDRIRFNRGSWTAMLPKALNEYNDTVHSSTQMKWNDAHEGKITLANSQR